MEINVCTQNFKRFLFYIFFKARLGIKPSAGIQHALTHIGVHEQSFPSLRILTNALPKVTCNHVYLLAPLLSRA